MVLPVGGIVPLQPPEAAQLFALAAFHCRVTDEPTGTVDSLAFRDTVGAGMAETELPVEESAVCAVELEPQAASEPRVAKPSIDFNANANLELWLRRIELITRLPIGTVHVKKICGGDSIHLAIIGVTYSFDFSNPPTCRHLQTTYV